MDNSGFVRCEYCGFLISEDLAVTGADMIVCPDCHAALEKTDEEVNSGFTVISNPLDFDV